MQDETNMDKRPSGFDIIEDAWEHLDRDTKQLWKPVEHIVHPTDSTCLYEVFRLLAQELDSNLSYDMRRTRETRKNLLKRLQKLLDAGAGEQFERYGTCIHTAVLLKRHEKVRQLIFRGENVKKRWRISGWTPLHLAVQNEDKEMVRILIDYDTELLRDTFGYTPFDHQNWCRVSTESLSQDYQRPGLLIVTSFEVL
jgi:hypothetical protein